MAKLLGRRGLKVSYARISEYETGAREPDLLMLLDYAEIVGVSMEALVDDKLSLPK